MMKSLIKIGIFLFIFNNTAVSQDLFSIQSIDSSIAHYKKTVNDINWTYYTPVFGCVIDCTEADTIIWSISNLKNSWAYEVFEPTGYYVFDSCYVLIRSITCDSIINSEWPIRFIDENTKECIKEALYPESVQINRIMKPHIYYSTHNNEMFFLNSYSYYTIPNNLLKIFPIVFQSK